MGVAYENPEAKGYIKNEGPMLKDFPKDAKALVPLQRGYTKEKDYYFAKATGNDNEFLVKVYVGNIRKKVEPSDIYFHPAWINIEQFIQGKLIIYNYPEGFDREP